MRDLRGDQVVVSEAGDITVDVQQLEQVRSIMQENGWPFSVDESAIRLNCVPTHAIVTLGSSVDRADVQTALDASN